MLFKKRKSQTVLKNKPKAAEVKETKKVEVKKPEKRTVSGKYVVFEDNNKFKYILKASNGEKLIESELYSTKNSVYEAISNVKNNLETGKYSISQDKSKLYQFRLIATNNRPIAVSANYVSKQNAESALESFKRFAMTSPIVEIEAPKDSLMEEIKVTKDKLKVIGKIEISKENEKFYFQLFANNGELLCTSQPYSTRSNCEGGVDTLKTSVNEGTFYVVKDKNKLFQFKLNTKAGRLIAIGQTYEDKQRAVSSANSVASFVDNAAVVNKINSTWSNL